MKKNAAIYARVSSDRQREQKTIRSQTALLLEYAQIHDYAVPEEWIFEDDGYSGSVLNRPGLERLRDLASEGMVEAVLVYAPDRLSRKYAYQVLLIEEFVRRGVEAVFLKSAGGDTPEDRLLVQFQGMIAEYERAQIAERTRRGKRHRARSGCVNVLSGAPYGYRYIRKTDTSEACYAVVETEAEVVREAFHLFTRELWSIGAIARELNTRGVPTRFKKSPWERSTIWGMLRNPAYKGSACFGKTERAERRRITRALRQKGGFSQRSSASCEASRENWIEVPVPALITAQTFEMARERLEENKRLSARRTTTPTLLQGRLVCGKCGYGLYLTSTKTTRRQVRYYRCLGSDKWRNLRGPACDCRPIRQDYLDELVWTEVTRLLHSPELVRAEIDRRLRENLDSDPVRQRKARLDGELRRIDAKIDKLLDAYQEDLLGLTDLRARLPSLKGRRRALEKELESLAFHALENGRLHEMNASMEGFLSRLSTSTQTLCVVERQKIIRLLTKEIIIDGTTLTVHHSIPISGKPEDPPGESCLLCTRSHDPSLLANVYLHWFDRVFHFRDGPHQWANARLIRYADDFVVMAKYQTQRLNEWIEAKLEGWLGLQINREKTKIVHVRQGQPLEFLGYSFRYIRDRNGSGDVYLTMEPSRKSQQRYRERIRELTGSHRNWLPVEELIADINRFQTGWRGYFNRGYPAKVFGKLNHYTSERVIRHLQRRSQRAFCFNPNQSRYAQLKQLGLQRL